MAIAPERLYPGVTLHTSLASRVFLDHASHAAVKIYTPPAPVKILYWLAFQAPFPYVRNENALRAASARRRIAGLLTRFWYGRDLVAPVLAIAHEGAAYAYVTRLIEGRTPVDKQRARVFLKDLAGRFQQVGLPTWQIHPRNPRAHENLIETPEGEYIIIDLESAVVSPVMPPGQWLDALRAGLLPVFDDLFLKRTRTYLATNADKLQQKLGEQGLSDLWAAIDDYEEHWKAWRRSEPRLWARLDSAVGATVRWASRVIKALWLPSTIPSLLRAVRQANNGQLAQTLVTNGVEQWRAEGRLDEATARQIERSIRAPEVLSVLRHLSAHAALSVPLRFPLGSVARAGWTLAFRAKAEWRALVRRKNDETTRAARRTHTATVALIAAVPGIGGAAYLAAEPLRKNRPLLAVGLDQILRKIPGRLHQRLHLGALTRWLALTRRQQRRRPLESLRPSRVLDETRTSLRSMRPHWRPIAIVLGTSSAAVVLGEVYGSGDAAFGEFGPITTFRVAQTALAGVTGILAYRLFWRHPDAELNADAAAGSFFWLGSGIGLIWLAVDDYLQVHESLGAALDAFAEIPLLNAGGDAVLLGYALAAVMIIAVFKGELTRSPAVAGLFFVGAAFAVLMLAVDGLGPRGSAVAGIDHYSHVMAPAFLLAAFVVKHREVADGGTLEARRRVALARPQGSPVTVAVPIRNGVRAEPALFTAATRREDS